jgi:hypothetical protein
MIRALKGDAMNSDAIAAAILTAAYAQAQRQPITLGVLDNSIREKFAEYLIFVREHTAPPQPAKKVTVKTRTKAESAAK